MGVGGCYLTKAAAIWAAMLAMPRVSCMPTFTDTKGMPSFSASSLCCLLTICGCDRHSISCDPTVVPGGTARHCDSLNSSDLRPIKLTMPPQK